MTSKDWPDEQVNRAISGCIDYCLDNGIAYQLPKAAMRAALQAALPPSPVQPEGWRPIETAPKDGTAVLLFCPKFYFGAGVYVGWWSGDYFEVCTEGATIHPYSDDGATHWMPLPPAPFIVEARDE